MNTYINNLHILMLHNKYQYAGGEDTATQSYIELLINKGNQVTFIQEDNQRIQEFSSREKLELFFTSPWNKQVYEKMRSQLQAIQPDLVHVHNFFPLFSPSIHTAAKSLNIPTIQHLHNFRLGCLNAYLFREGKVCELCVNRNPWRGIVYRCYQNSLPASISIWNMITVNRRRKTWSKDVDAFITPSQFAANKLIEIGIPQQRLYINPNVIDDPLQGQPITPIPNQPKFLYIGRLSPEKGVMTLLKAWDRIATFEWQLEIIGTGPHISDLETFVKEKNLNNVNFRGFQPMNQVFEIIKQAMVVIVPSQWYETFGRVVIEAFACGRGVIASNIGALTELVTEGKTGFLVPPHDINAWAERLQWSANHPLEMNNIGQQSRQIYFKYYTPTANYQQLIDIYQKILH